jgi:hypothetical protein
MTSDEYFLLVLKETGKFRLCRALTTLSDQGTERERLCLWCLLSFPAVVDILRKASTEEAKKGCIYSTWKHCRGLCRIHV